MTSYSWIDQNQTYGCDILLTNFFLPRTRIKEEEEEEKKSQIYNHDRYLPSKLCTLKLNRGTKTKSRESLTIKHNDPLKTN